MPRNKKYVYICSPKRKVFPCGMYWRDAGVVDRAALEMRCTGNCTGGSNPSLSAIKGVNQAFARFTPFFTPKNVKLGVFVFLKILQKNVNYKAIGISMDWQNEPL